MLSGLTNEPNTFMKSMNHILHAFIGNVIIIYINDTLVFSKSLDEHVKHLRFRMKTLKNERLYANMKECKFLH